MMLFVRRRVPLRMVKVWVELFMGLLCHNISPDKGMCLTPPLDFIGFLIGLLKHLTRHHAPTVFRDADTQTSKTTSYGESLGTIKWYLYTLTCPALQLYLLMFSFIMTSLYPQWRRWKALIKNMKTSVLLGTNGLPWNQNWLRIEKKLRHRHKQKWTQRYIPQHV